MQNDERDRLTPDDARFVEQLRAHYTPPALGPAQRAAFDAKLRDRLDRPRWRGALLPGLAAAAVAALAIWWPTTAFTPTGEPAAPTQVAKATPAPAPAQTGRRVSAEAREPGTEAVLFYYDSPADAQQNAQAELPPELAAIDGLFFDDV